VKPQPKFRDRLHARLDDLVDFLGVAIRFGQPNDLPVIRHAENQRTAQRVRKSADALAPAFGLFHLKCRFLVVFGRFTDQVLHIHLFRPSFARNTGAFIIQLCRGGLQS